MPRPLPTYSCTVCGREVGKFCLYDKRAVFKEVGKGGRSKRTRTVAWLCTVPQEDGSPSCLHKDPDWNKPAYLESPGMLDTKASQEHREASK
jgi:hypothetical protein